MLHNDSNTPFGQQTQEHNSQTNSILEAALHYIKLGFAVIPLKPRSKVPSVKWKTEFIRKPAKAKEFWTANPTHGVGVHLGESGLCSIDIDSPEDAAAVFKNFNIDIYGLRNETATIVGTPGRFRMLFQTEKNITGLVYQKLVWSGNTIFELRSGVHYDCFPPSAHPLDGVNFQWLNHASADGITPKYDDIIYLLENRALLELWLNFRELQPELEAMEPTSMFERDEHTAKTSVGDNGVDVIQQFNRCHDIEKMMDDNSNYSRVSKRRYIPKNSTSGEPGILLNTNNTLVCFHASDVLSGTTKSGKQALRDTFDLFRLWNYGGDWKEATKAAAQLLGIDYSSQQQSKKEQPRSTWNGSKKGTPGGTPPVEPVGSWDDPQPLGKVMASPQKFPIHTLGNVLSDAANCLLDNLQFPDSLVCQSLLAATGLAVQPYINVVVDGRCAPLTGYYLMVAESGEGKSAVERYTLAPHREYESKLAKRYKREYAEYERDLLAWKKAEQAIRGKDLAKNKADLEKIGSKPVAPMLYIVNVDDPTVQGLFRTLHYGRPTLGMHINEGGQLLGGYAMTGEQKLHTYASLSKIWDGDILTITRAGDGESRMEARRLSMHLQVQPIVAAKLLGDDLAIQQGMLARTLCAYPDSKIGTRLTYTGVDLNEEPAMKVYRGRFRDLLDRALPLVEGTRDVLNPRDVPLSSGARSEWIRFKQECEAGSGKDGKYYSIKAFAVKTNEHVLRIVGALAMISEKGALDNVKEIAPDIMENAIELSRFYLSEALRMHGFVGEDMEIEKAKKVHDYLRKVHKGQYFIPADVYRQGIASLGSMKALQPILDILESHGWIRKAPKDTEVAGKKRSLAYEVGKGVKTKV